jgi:hypothetical protein
MTTEEQVKKTVTDFVRAGDNNNLTQLSDVLHEQFQNVQDGFFEKQGVFVFSKEDYKKLVETKRFGGTPRTIEFGAINISGNIAHVEVRLESQFLIFTSMLLLCKEDEKWMVILNVPKIEVK